VAGIPDKQTRHSISLNYGLFLSPDLDKSSINCSEDGCGFGFVFSLLPTCSGNVLTPSFEATPRPKITIPRADKLFVWIVCPIDFLQLTFP